MARILQFFCIGLLVQTPAFAQVDLNAARRHVFPQIVDGRFDDGTGYATSFSITNLSTGWTHCEIWTVGLEFVRVGQRSFWIYGRGVHRVQTANSREFASGYAILECNRRVTALTTFRRTDPEGRTIGMATQPSAPEARRIRQFVTRSGNQRTAIAIVNGSLRWTRRYQLTLFDEYGRTLDVRFLDLAPGGSISRFVDELVRLPAGGFIGSLEVRGSSFHAAGLLYEGEVFATVPLTLFDVYETW